MVLKRLRGAGMEGIKGTWVFVSSLVSTVITVDAFVPLAWPKWVGYCDRSIHSRFNLRDNPRVYSPLLLYNIDQCASFRVSKTEKCGRRLFPDWFLIASSEAIQRRILNTWYCDVSFWSDHIL